MSYSYSKISCFEQCPYRYKLQYIDKLPTPFSDNAVFEKGRFMHTLLEHHPVKPAFKFKYSEVKQREEEYRAFIHKLATEDKKMKFLLDNRVFAEKNFYLDHNFKIIPGKKDSHLNGIIDYVGKHGNKIILVDWKSGQTQDMASLDQLEFYSPWAFEHFPDTEAVNCFLYFIEQNAWKNSVVDKQRLEEIKNKYKSKIQEIESTKVFEKRRNPKCKWCPFFNECNKLRVTRG